MPLYLFHSASGSHRDHHGNTVIQFFLKLCHCIYFIVVVTVTVTGKVTVTDDLP